MEIYRYRKPTNVMNNTGKTKGVKTGRMNVFFRDGNPYKEGMVVKVIFKKKVSFAKIEKINEQSITAEVKGVGKKVILFQNIIEIFEVGV